MSVKIIKQKQFDVSGIIKSTFNPGDDISISYPNYLKVCARMADAVDLMKRELRPVNPKNQKGTFLWFKSTGIAFKPTPKTKKEELERFNTFYANFKKGANFQEFFNFADAIERYNAFTEEEKIAVHPYKIIYNSASGSAKCAKFYMPKIGDPVSEMFCTTIVAISNAIKKTIIVIDKSDRSSITLEHIFGKILELVKKSNPQVKIPPGVKDIFGATYDAFQAQIDEIYAGYIFTGSELGMFVKLVNGLVTSLKSDGAGGPGGLGQDDKKDEALFRDLISLLNSIKEAVVKELSTNERNDLSDEKMEELRNTISMINSISENPDEAVKDLVGSMGL